MGSKKWLGVVTLMITVACWAESPLAPGRNHPGISPPNPTHLGAPAALLLQQPGFTAEVVASGLTTPEGAAMLGNGVLYVVRSRVGDIVRVLPSGRSETFTEVPVAAPPEVALIDLLLDPSRGLFVSVLRHGKIFNVSFNGAVTEVATVPLFPSIMAFDPDGVLYVALLGARRSVMRLESTGATSVVESDQADERVKAIAFDDRGALYVAIADFAQTVIRRFDVSASASLPASAADGDLIAAGLPGRTVGGVSEVIDIAWWRETGGDLFAATPGSIFRVNLADGDVSRFASGLMGPFNLLGVTAAGDLLVSDYGIGEVIRIRPRP